MTGKILITGAAGYFGGVVARHYLMQTDHELLLHARGWNPIQQDQLLRDVGSGASRRVTWSSSSLEDEAPLSGLPAQDIERIVHTAAITNFNVERPRALAVNIEGTRKVLEFARSCPQLQNIGIISTLYVCGLRGGKIEERVYDDDCGFANHYEWSKCQAERMAVYEYSDLPFSILRVPTIFAHDDDGLVIQQNAFHTATKLYYHGLLSLVPGRADTPLYLMTGVEAARMVVALVGRPGTHEVYHLCYGRDQSPDLGNLLSATFAVFETYDTFRRRRILKPLFAENEETFDLFQTALLSTGSGVLQSAVGALLPFARQMYIERTLVNDRICELKRTPAPDLATLVRRATRYLIETNWGRGKRGESSGSSPAGHALEKHL